MFKYMERSHKVHKVMIKNDTKNLISSFSIIESKIATTNIAETTLYCDISRTNITNHIRDETQPANN